MAAGAAMATGLVLAACGSDDGGDAGAPVDTAPVTEVEATDTTEDAGGDPFADGPDEIVVAIDETVWFEGFTIDLEQAVITIPPSETMDSTVVVTATATNLVDDSNERPTSAVSLEIGELELPDQGARPLVEGGDTEPWEMRFVVPPELDPESAVVVVGDEDSLQRRVPLDGSEDLFTGAPVELEVPDALTHDGFGMVFEVAEVHFDPPYTHRSAFEDRAYLWLVWTATNETDEQARRPAMRLNTPGGGDHVQSGRGEDLDLEPGASVEVSAHWEFEIDESGTFVMVGTGLDSTQLAELEVPPLPGSG